jgi:hypothetical protein
VKYVSVRNLERYQHYRERRPVWIKLHLSLRLDEDFAGLTPTARLLFIYALLLAAERENRIPADPSWLSVEVGMTRPVIAKALDELLADSYLIPASKVASNGASRIASPEKETEVEKEKHHHPLTPSTAARTG